MRDVIVIGTGPAGSAAAKRCAEHGLDTLMLEKRTLPRDKVCSGMVMGPVAHTLIKQEFGALPESILSQPGYLSGYMFHVPGVGSQKLDNFTLLGWRRDIDYWMSQRAQTEGVEIWQGARVTNLRQKRQGFLVEIEKGRERLEVETKFVIGADGATSVVRKSLFPDLKVNYVQVYQEYYRGELDLDKNYFHWFRSVGQYPPNFAVHFKDGFIVVDIGGRIGQIKEPWKQMKKFLAQNYNFDINQKPAWREGCLEPVIYGELISYAFQPAKGNALLVGDAGGLILPVTGEGIGTAIKTGLLAADSIKRAIESGEQPDKVYLAEIDCIISIFRELSSWPKKIADERSRGGQSLPQILRDACYSTLRVF